MKSPPQPGPTECRRLAPDLRPEDDNDEDDDDGACGECWWRLEVEPEERDPAPPPFLEAKLELLVLVAPTLRSLRTRPAAWKACCAWRLRFTLAHRLRARARETSSCCLMVSINLDSGLQTSLTTAREGHMAARFSEH